MNTIFAYALLLLYVKEAWIRKETSNLNSAIRIKSAVLVIIYICATRYIVVNLFCEGRKLTSRALEWSRGRRKKMNPIYKKGYLKMYSDGQYRRALKFYKERKSVIKL